MSTLFAMSQVALFGRDLSPTPEDAASTAELSSGSTATSSVAALGWSMPESTSAPQPPRWRINSGDLEEMVLRAAVGLGLDKGVGSDGPPHLEDPIASPPLSREDLVEEPSPVGFPVSSRGSSPLYRKSGCSAEYQLDPTVDTTAPSSPCTPSMHIRSLSAVSPTSSRSDEASFQHQLSPDGSCLAPSAAAVPRPRSAGGGVIATQQGSPGSSSGRFGLKLLVSNSMAGTLIGKGGTRICEIKDECLADIKVTPNGRFYPGTHERVVLVVGEPGSVQMACDRIVTTIYTAADTSLDITQRVLIPDAASGLIIGHDGGRLGDLRQQAGVASIQVSPRDMCTVAGERVVTLQGPMSAVILGLTLIVDRMMEDTTASRYQNMSTIYRAVHLHLPPYAVPGMHDGNSPRHPHPRLSPSYAGPSPQHGGGGGGDFHSPAAGGAQRGGNREYGNVINGAPHWEFGYSNGGREVGPHGASGGGGGGSTPVDYPHRSISMPVMGHDLGSPGHHRRHTDGAHHFGGRHLRAAGGEPINPINRRRDFDFNDADIVRGRGVSVLTEHEVEMGRHDFESLSPGDIGSRPGSREGYVHHSPRSLPGPSPRDAFDHMRHQQHPGEGNRSGFSAGRGGYPTAGSQQAEYLPLQQQQQRLRQQQHQQQQQQQQQHLSRPSGPEFSQESAAMYHGSSLACGSTGVHDGRPVSTGAAQHRVSGEGSIGGALPRSCSATTHGGMPSGGELRRCHSVAVGASGGGHGDASGLSGMFDGMRLNSSHGMAPPGASPPPLQQQQQQGGNGAGCMVHGELPVPDADVGIILGKGGATVRELQQLSGAKIMIARRNEFMPGTKHRLVTLAGAPLAVNMARFLIMRKIQTEKEKL